MPHREDLPRQVSDVNDYTAVVNLAVSALHLAAFVHVLNPEDRTTTSTTMSTSTTKREQLPPQRPKTMLQWCGHDYFHYLPDIDYLICYDYFDYVDYVHYYDYAGYFLHVPKISFFPSSNPKITSFHTCAPKP